LSIPDFSTLPIRAPSPAPTAIPKNGTKNSMPNSTPQNIPKVAPPPTAWWLVVTRSLPSRLRTIAATASGWMTRSRSSRPTSSMAAIESRARATGILPMG
jgi:hypothetical protein